MKLLCLHLAELKKVISLVALLSHDGKNEHFPPPPLSKKDLTAPVTSVEDDLQKCWKQNRAFITQRA